MNHSDIKLVIDRLHAVEFSPHEADDLAIVHAIDMLEKLGNQVAEQAAVIEKLRDAHKKVVRSSNMEDKLEIAMISHTALAIPTDSTQILQEWLDEKLGDPVAWLYHDNPGGHDQYVQTYEGHSGAFPTFKKPEKL